MSVLKEVRSVPKTNVRKQNLMQSKSFKSVLFWLILSPIVILTLFPYAVMITTALKPATEIYSNPPTWFGSHLEWGNFARVWEMGFGQNMLNSIWVTLAATFLALLVSFPAAYSLSRFNHSKRFSGFYRQFLLATQMLSPIIITVGIFKVVASLKMIDSFTPLILIYATFNIAFCTWMLQSYFNTIPGELEEAAWIDGCSRFQSFTHIFLPLALPATAIAALFSFIYCWNEFVLAFLVLRTPEHATITMRVFSLVGGRYTVEWELVMAAAVLATLPMVLMFVFLQRQIIRGLAMGSIK